MSKNFVGNEFLFRTQSRNVTKFRFDDPLLLLDVNTVQCKQNLVTTAIESLSGDLSLKASGNLAIKSTPTFSDGTSASAWRSALSVPSSSEAQPASDRLSEIAGLAVTDGNIIVGDGGSWVAESGATARASLGLEDESATLRLEECVSKVVKVGGSGQSQFYTLFRNTTDDTKTVLTLDGLPQESGNVIAHAEGEVSLYELSVFGKRSDAEGNFFIAKKYRVLVFRPSGGDVEELGSQNEEEIYNNSSSAAIGLDCNRIDQSLLVKVTGETDRNYTWVCSVHKLMLN